MTQDKMTRTGDGVQTLLDGRICDPNIADETWTAKDESREVRVAEVAVLLDRKSRYETQHSKDTKIYTDCNNNTTSNFKNEIRTKRDVESF